MTLFRQRSIRTSHFLGQRNDKILYYDCSNYYFEIEQEDGSKKYGKSKVHTGQTPIIQMGLFMDGDGIPLAVFPIPRKRKRADITKAVREESPWGFRMPEIIYCSDAGLGSEAIREYNHMGERAYIVTQSVKKLAKEEKEWR